MNLTTRKNHFGFITNKSSPYKKIYFQCLNNTIPTCYNEQTAIYCYKKQKHLFLHGLIFTKKYMTTSADLTSRITPVLLVVLTVSFFKFENRLFFFQKKSTFLFKTKSNFNSLIFVQGEFAYEGFCQLRDSSRSSQ